MADKNTKAVAKFLNKEIVQAIPINRTEGMLYGLELELEGRNVAMEGVPTKGWRRVRDGSLRGENSEYVFTAPCGYEEALDRVKKLFDLFKKNDVRIQRSYRTSTHVHLNFSDKKIRSVVNFFCLFTMIEEILEVYCGEGRAGNLFCLSSRDVEPIVKMLESAVLRNHNFHNFDDNIRYCAANLASLNKFGSIEIRTMRGAENEEQVKDWMLIISQLYDYAVNRMESPAKLIESLSFRGSIGFLEQFFDRMTIAKLTQTWGNDRNLDQSLFTGARLIQLLVYRVEEAFCLPFEELQEEHDPNQEYVFLKKEVFPVPSNVEDMAMHVAEYGRTFRWVSAAGRWQSLDYACYVNFCDERGLVIGNGRKARANAPRQDAEGRLFINHRGRKLYVPANPADMKRCPGINEIVFHAGVDFWYDTVEGLYLDYVDEDLVTYRSAAPLNEDEEEEDEEDDF